MSGPNRQARRQMERKGDVRRQFSYAKGTPGTPEFTQLNFSLRVDIKTELKEFLELLKAAVVDVEEELAKKI